jgi:hypothetical protein
LIVTAVLQKYADRGVFRGFSVARRARGRYQYTFTWLMQRPFTLTYDPAHRLLSFDSLFPQIAARSAMANVLRGIVAERSSRRVPAHKRLDGRRVQADCAVARRRFTLAMRVRGAPGAHEEYAVRQLLNLVNELFLALHETYPDYLIAHFGLSSE